MTQNRIVTVGASGELEDSANLQFVSNSIILGGNMSGSGNLQFAGAAIFEGAMNLSSSLVVGQGFGNSGTTIEANGNINTNGNLVVDGTSQLKDAVTVGESGGGVDVTIHGAATGERVFFDASENILQISGAADSGLQVNIGGDSTSEFAIDVANGSNNNNKIRAAAFVTYSDESLKTEVTSMSDTALDTIMSLNGVEFTWKNNGERDFGFIAQEVQKVVPKAVHTHTAGVQGVDYSRLTSILVEAVKAQQVQIDDLKKALKKQ